MANKKGPLSKSETFYIDEHVKSGKSINDIASDLDRAISSIEKRVVKAKKDNNIKTPTCGDQFARRAGVTIMTENASSMGDVKRKTGHMSAKISKCVTTIKQDE